MKLGSWVAKSYYFAFILALIHNEIRRNFFAQECIFWKKESKLDAVFLLNIKFFFIRFVATLLIKTLSVFEACVFIMWLYIDSTSRPFFLSCKILIARKTRSLNVDNPKCWLSFSLLFISLIMLWFKDKLLKAVFMWSVLKAQTSY